MDAPDRYDVFISYSRRNLGFAEQLRDYLQHAGKVCWLDASHIQHGQEWWPAIMAAIERSACVVCLVSPAYLQSQFCHAEAEHAKRLNKKIIHVLWHDAAAIPAPVMHINAIPYRENAAVADTAELVRAALERDFDYERQRRELLTKAGEWHRSGRRSSQLLRGRDLAEAAILLKRCTADRAATDLQRAYVGAGQAFRRRSLAGRAGVAAALLVLSATVVMTERVVHSRELAAAASALAATDPAAALAQAVRALQAAPTEQADAADFGYPFTTLRAHHDSVRGVEFSPDGALLASAGMDGSARVWDLAAGSSAPLGRPGARVRHARFSTDGARIATSGDDCSIGVWRVVARRPVTLALEAVLGGAGCGPASARFVDATTIWVGSGHGIGRWRLAGGKWQAAGQVHPAPADDFAISPDGRWLATYQGATITLVDRSGARPDWRLADRANRPCDGINVDQDASHVDAVANDVSRSPKSG